MNFDYVYIVVIERPILTKGPTDVTGVKKHDSVHFECHFNASMIPYLALCGWLKDEDIVNNGEKSQQFVPEFNDHLMICGLTINGASAADEGSYSCYCYYNITSLNHFEIMQPVVSQKGTAVLQLESILLKLLYILYIYVTYTLN